MDSSSDGNHPRIRISIDRGGTFTDVYAEIDRVSPSGTTLTTEHVFKLLSVDPDKYPDAPQEAIRRTIELATGTPQSRTDPIRSDCIEWIRMGTTIATNALLEKKGEPCALAITAGLRDVLAIGHQARPKIFDLKVRMPTPLYSSVAEVKERVRVAPKGAGGSSRVDELREGTMTAAVQFREETPVDEDDLRANLGKIRARGITSLAVALMHSYANPEHEQVVRRIAEDVGFTHISLSSDLTPMVRIVPRGLTAVVDAYLSPKIKSYIAEFRAGFDGNLSNVNVQFMQSDGGLCDIGKFAGYLAVLSGPAGGVVGYGRTAYGCELGCPEADEGAKLKPVIGFDMGGTSTDVSRFEGSLSHIFETEIAGVSIQAPQLEILTVAAGGGSRLFYRSGMFHVGPESVGAFPGPVCYRKGGSLAVTDANLVLGRVVPEMFPAVFGPNADQPLDAAASRKAFEELANEINDYLRGRGEVAMSVEEIAEGFLTVADETMCRPVRKLTESKGFDVRNHVLACFGGAGGQHACSVAKSLGIRSVHVHKYSGVLSAYGTGLADSVVDVQTPLAETYEDESSRKAAIDVLLRLSAEARTALEKRGIPRENVALEQYLHLRYEGTDFGLMVKSPKVVDESVPLKDIPNFGQLFEEQYHREHGFSIQNRSIKIDDARVRATGTQASRGKSTGVASMAPITVDESGQPVSKTNGNPQMIVKSYFSDAGGWIDVSVLRLSDLQTGAAIVVGPGIIVDSVAGMTVMVLPGCVARVTGDGNLFIDVDATSPDLDRTIPTVREMDPVRLSVYAHRFMGIAEQMGNTLQRTAVSTNIKERLDFSCAIFDDSGGLVANAPHVPVHLGAMQDAVRYQIRLLGEKWKEGDVILTNHPSAGGTHLPDVTVITPVVHDQKTIFYVASRGHQADIGGSTPGSMPPFSTSLSEEGLAIRSMVVVRDGEFKEGELVGKLQTAGCRCIGDVMSDIRAQVAANNRGIALVGDLIEGNGLDEVQTYMVRIQHASEIAVRGMLRNICRERGLKTGEALRFTDAMDDGTAIALSISIDADEGTACFDFDGTGPQVDGNTNAPASVTNSAIIYALRCLVDVDIPLNQGCLTPITISIPGGSLLKPDARAAVVGGNVLTSQRVTDVVLGAFGACAASQGCMNNCTFGHDGMGYYETIAGGAGAGDGWRGSSGVQVHMTNTRMTDAEILEVRYPAVLRQFLYREGSGGNGKWRGGDGVVREMEFTEPLTVSVLSERRKLAPWGMRGGGQGAKGVNEYFPLNGEASDIGGKGCLKVAAGDCVRISTPGGGGYGN